VSGGRRITQGRHHVTSSRPYPMEAGRRTM
jgi:hypothetical protein